MCLQHYKMRKSCEPVDETLCINQSSTYTHIYTENEAEHSLDINNTRKKNKA